MFSSSDKWNEINAKQYEAKQQQQTKKKEKKLQQQPRATYCKA